MSTVHVEAAQPAPGGGVLPGGGPVIFFGTMAVLGFSRTAR
jgi:hypothetical protein